MTPNYRIQPKNATACNILRSWLTAVGVPYLPPAQFHTDLRVECRLGGVIDVQVALAGAPEPPEGAVRVRAADLVHKRTGVALEAFWSVTAPAGYGTPVPVNRGADPAANERGNPKKLHYRDEEFLVSIRHTEFRRSPNPPKDRWKHYQPTMEKTVWEFLRRYGALCKRHGLGAEDLMQHARCYVVNFCARYETQEEVYCDNARKCHSFLRQRFNCDLRPILLKKERSMLPDAETVAISLYGRPDANIEVAHADEAEEEVDYDYVAKHCQLDTSSPAARRASAAAKLQELLEALPHDQMVEVLVGAADNEAFDFTTRQEAVRQLKLHGKACSSCHARVEKYEELAGVDGLGAEEEVPHLFVGHRP